MGALHDNKFSGIHQDRHCDSRNQDIRYCLSGSDSVHQCLFLFFSKTIPVNYVVAIIQML